MCAIFWNAFDRDKRRTRISKADTRSQRCAIWRTFPSEPAENCVGIPRRRKSSATRSQDSTAIGFQGYNIYRSTPTGSFIKLNASPSTDLDFTDTTALAGNYTYMVRAVKLESGSSGTYYNASQGVFDNMGAATVLGVDAATQGDWKTAYGADGYDIAGDSAADPIYAITSTTGVTTQVWESPSADARGLLFADSSERLVAAWHAQPSLTIDVQFTDGLAHQISLYALDWDDAGRAEQVQVFDAQNGSLLLFTDLREFSGGKFLKLRLAGHVQIKLTSLTSSDAVLSGIFFDP